MRNFIFYSSLKSLVIGCQEIQELGDYHHMSMKQFLKEVATIKISGSRRMGHTTAIVQFLIERNTPAVVLLPNHSILRNFQELYAKMASESRWDHLVAPEVLSYQNFEKWATGRNMGFYEALIVDNSSFMSESMKERIYDILSGGFFTDSKPCFVIFVQ